MVKQRFQALDVMRGLTLALMILVNTPGSWSFVYAPLEHADWNGVTPTDFVFPFFLFIVGSAMYFSVKGLSQLSTAQQLQKIARRTLLLFVIGVLLQAFPFTKDFHDWRIMGVLQRIALAYGAAALIVLYAGQQLRILIVAAILLGYWALLSLSADPYSLEHNLVRQLDLAVLGANHLWQGKGLAFDPEGLLSTLPAVVNVVLGFEATRLLIGNSDKAQAIRQLLMLSVILILAALLWNNWLPINKSLWTSSYVLLTSGVATAFLVLLIKLEQWHLGLMASPVKSAFNACAIMGKNPLFIYCVSFLWSTTMWVVVLGNSSIYEGLFNFFRQFAEPYFASLLFALLQVTIFWLVAWVLHKRNIVISL